MQTEIKISDIKNSALLISDVLHLAADEYLAKDYRETRNSWTRQYFSCDAIDMAMDDLTDGNWDKYEGIHARIVRGLEAMGCKTRSTEQFLELEIADPGYDSLYKCTPESQQARYFWLKWAALMAEEQENEVFVKQGE